MATALYVALVYRCPEETEGMRLVRDDKQPILRPD